MQAGNREQGPATLLVVEDDQEMRAILKDSLEADGYRVIAEPGAERAIATAEGQPIDVAIVDKELPGMSGLDLLSLIRQRFPQTPVILITAFGGSRVAEEAFRRGASRYLEKPFRVTDLLAALRTVVDEPRPPFPDPVPDPDREPAEPEGRGGR